MEGESDDVIQDFECVFSKVGLINSHSTYLTDCMDYAYDYIDGTEIYMLYFWENSKSRDSTIGTFSQYGEIKRITDHIYVTYYALPYE